MVVTPTKPGPITNTVTAIANEADYGHREHNSQGLRLSAYRLEIKDQKEFAWYTQISEVSKTSGA